MFCVPAHTLEIAQGTTDRQQSPCLTDWFFSFLSFFCALRTHQPACRDRIPPPHDRHGGTIAGAGARCSAGAWIRGRIPIRWGFLGGVQRTQIIVSAVLRRLYPAGAGIESNARPRPKPIPTKRHGDGKTEILVAVCAEAWNRQVMPMSELGDMS